jgi:hypothetical protein
MHVGGIFCDLPKTTDFVNHEIFLAKLHFISIQRTTANSFRSYLTKREQTVEIKPFSAAPNFFPKWRTVTYGVPQAPILGPPHLITHK